MNNLNDLDHKESYEPIPVATLSRISTTTERQDYERQVSELDAFAKQQGYIVTERIAFAVSGFKSQKRPDLEQLIDGARKRKFKKVLVLEVSRLGRKAKSIRSTIDELHSYGVSVVFKNLGGLESLVDGKDTFVTNVIIAIYAELAQEERHRLITNIKSGLEHAKRNGKTLGRKTGSAETEQKLLEKYPKLVRDIRQGKSLNDLIKLNDVSKNTAIKIRRIVCFQK